MAAGFSFEFKGVGQMKYQLKRLEKKYPDAAATVLREEARETLRDVKARYVPVDRGFLKDSGRTWAVSKKGAESIVRITFGGRARKYALAVHEHPSGSSPRSWRGKGVSGIRSVQGRVPWVVMPSGGRGPKYLTRALNYRARKGTLAKRIRDVFKNKGLF